MAGLFTANKECEEHPNNLYLITRKEWVDLRDSTIHDWNEFVGRPINGEKNVIYPNGSVLMFRHGADLNALKNSNLGGALMVQGEEENEDVFWFLNGRLRRKNGTRQLRVECNYDGHNWIYKLFNEQKIGALITTNTFDNEANLPPDYIPNLKKLPKKLQERHLYGSDADMEGAVFDEYSQARHLIQPFNVPEEWAKTVVLDHGFTNPTAVLWAAVDYDGKVYVYDEHYEKERLVSYHAEEIKKRNNKNVHSWLIDPSCRAKTNQKNGQIYSIIDEYAQEGLFFFPADNDVLSGVNRVNEYFKNDELFIFKNCVNLIDEISQYKWQTIKPGQEKNEPDKPCKVKDHACDCLRYLVASRPRRNEPPKRVAPRGSVAAFIEEDELKAQDWRGKYQ